MEKLVLENHCKPNSKIYNEIAKSLENRPKRKERYMQIRKGLIDLINKTGDTLFKELSLSDCNACICENYSEDDDVHIIAGIVYENMRNACIKSNGFNKAQNILKEALRKEFGGYTDELVKTDMYENIISSYCNNEKLMRDFLINC